MKNGGWVYVMTNKWNTVFYVGVTSNLIKRIHQHTSRFFSNSFTARYNICKLVYYCWFPAIEQAIAEEKRIKGGSRLKKIELVKGMNPDLKNLEVTLQI